jgi:hypothetical protein
VSILICLAAATGGAQVDGILHGRGQVDYLRVVKAAVGAGGRQQGLDQRLGFVHGGADSGRSS